MTKLNLFILDFHSHRNEKKSNIFSLNKINNKSHKIRMENNIIERDLHFSENSVELEITLDPDTS